MQHHYPKLRRIGLVWFALLLTGCSALPPLPLPATSPSSTPVSGIGSTQIAWQDGMVLMYVPAGEFRMGSASTEAAYRGNDDPGKCDGLTGIRCAC